MTFPTRLPILLGLLTVAALILGLGVWGARASLAGAVIAQGQIQIAARAQVVQHPDGGVVREILVRDGDRVTAGAPLIRLDGAELSSRRTILSDQIDELTARAARLRAERDDAPAVEIPADLTARAATAPRVAEIIAGQQSLFDARLATLTDAARSYEEQKAQAQNEIDGQRAQIAALADQMDLIEQERAAAQALLDKGLTESSRVLALRREAARLSGQKGETEAAVARNLGRIAQLDIEILRLSATRREEAETELRDVQVNLAQLSEELAATDKKLARLDLAAPMDGIVHDLRFHTIGAVIRTAEPALSIIPDAGELTVTARIDIFHIDQVFVGQDATLRFSALNARTTPELMGKITRVSADTTVDERTGTPFYTADLTATPEEVARLNGQPLIPGMPVEVFVQTGMRSPLSYIAKPFTDYFARAFRE